MQKLNFLVVDDASFIRDLVKRTLKSQFHQCQIDEAINGKKAQALLAKRRYDLILCDWEMPELTGLEVLQWLREYEKETGSAKSPFMMVTSRGEKAHVVSAVESGVSGYIGKPFSSEQLLTKVLKLLSVNHKDLIRSILKGTSVMQNSAYGSGNDSASVLTAKTVESVKPAAPIAAPSSAGLLTAGSPSSSLVNSKPGGSVAARPIKKTLGKVVLRSPRAQWKGVLRDVSLTDLSIMVDFSEQLSPQVLDQVVVDIHPEGMPVARINTFITSVALKDKALDCHIARVDIRIVDDDTDKIATLSHFVAQVR